MGIVDEHLSQLLNGGAGTEPGLMAIFDDLHVGIALLDRELCYRYLNQTALRVTQRLGENPLGASVEVLATKAYGSEKAGQVLGIFEEVLRSGQPHHQKAWSLAERQVAAQDAWFDWSLYRVKSSEGVIGLLLTLTDVTDHILTQVALQKQERLLRTVVDSVPGLLAFIDRDQRYVFANRAYQNMLGVDPGSMAGRSLAEIAGPEAYARVKPMVEQALAGQVAIWEHQLEWPNSRSRYMHGQYIPVFGSDGQVDGFIALVQDFTERHQMEQRLERQNQELEQFAGLAAHDLQAPLRQASLQTELLGMDLEPQLAAEHRESLDQLRAGLGRMQALVKSLLIYARSGARDVAMGEVPLMETLEAALKNLAEQIDEHQAEVVLPEALPLVYGERSLLTQVFQNLLSNGIKFCKQTPRLVVEHRTLDGMHEIQISDNGIGMTREQLDQAFLSFKRLHGSEYEGTGLGLASCQKVVELHGGRIWAESPADGGCRFIFTLRRA